MAQDRLWLNGSQLLDFNPPDNGAPITGVTMCNLPLGHDYNGTPAKYAQNAQYDESGRLLFFVVDGNIYDHAGYLIADNDASLQCTDCIPRGIQEVSIVLMPGTCDKYYIITGSARNYVAPGIDPACQWLNAGEQSFLAYSILDLSLPSRYYAAAGRKGRVWHYLEDWSVNPLVTANTQAFEHMVNQLYIGCQPASGDPAVFKMASGNFALSGNMHNSSRQNNIYHLVYEGATPGASKMLFARTAMEYLQAPVTPYGIPNMQLLTVQGNYVVWASEAFLGMTGGMAGAQGPDGVVRLASTWNMNYVLHGADDPTLDLLKVQLGGYASLIAKTTVATCPAVEQGSNPSGRVRGIAFDPTGRYLYFAQPKEPYIGYVDVLDPALAVHDVAAELNLSPAQFAPYAMGQIRLNRAPTGTGHAIYFPYAGGMGCLVGVDAPTQLAWHANVPGTAPAGPPAASAVLGGQYPQTVQTRYLMDAQNYRDQQLASLGQAACCLSNERIPEWSHAFTYSGTNTANTPWTTTQNGLTGPMLCTWPTNANGQPIGHVYFDRDFVIQTGAKLFVQGMEWRFAPNARLIVEKGAFVRFDNCILRGGACGPERWPGVDLRSNPTMAQGAASYPPNHAKMVFNNSILQDAEVGVTAGRKSGFFGIVQFAGGILQASGSTFRNCRVGVNFYPYKNILSGGTEISNNSRFYNCTFTTDAGYINHPADGYDFAVQAQLWKVKGIPFQGCTFQNLRTTENLSSKRGQGIRSLDAQFAVKPRCADPGPVPGGMCQNVVPSRFIDLDHGIYAAKASNLLSFSVEGSEFNDNVAGVFVRGVPNFIVEKNNFNIGGSHATTLDNIEENNWFANRGTYSYFSQGFRLEHNIAQPSVNHVPGTPKEGFITGWSGASDDLVRWNTTNNLNVGFAGEGICAIMSLNPIHGLLYRCNVTNGDNQGIRARTTGSNPFYSQYQTIRYFQGHPGAPAGNQFINNVVDLKNDNPNRWFGYWWWEPQPNPYRPFTTEGLVDVHISRKENRCDDNMPVQPINNGDMAPAESDPVAYRAYLMGVAQARKLEYGTTRYLYNQLIDGGNTDETVQEIQETWPGEAWEMRAMLLQKSPYLSAEVLMEAVKRNIMPAAMIAEIYIANPEAVQRAGLLKWLQVEAPIVMPQYLLDNIAASWNQRTYRTTLEENLSFSRGEMSQAIYHVLASYNADTNGVRMDSLRATLRVLRTPDARYMEILSYLQEDNFDSAYAVMDRLPVEFKLKDKEISEKDRTKQYISLVQGWRMAGRSDAELKESEVAALQAFAEDQYDRPAEWAQNLLCFGYGICRAPLSGGDGEQPMAMRRPVTMAIAPAPLLKLAPNPADAWVAMNYRLETKPDEARLVVRDATGRELDQIPVAHAEGQAVYDTRQLAPGTYTVELVNAGQHVDAQKLVVR